VVSLLYAEVSRRCKWPGKRSLHSEAIEGSGITVITVRVRLIEE
jgi:hypothetical protein